MTWTNLTEQWPFRIAMLITFYEMLENKYNDDGIPLKTLYEKIAPNVANEATLSCRDNDEKKFNVFLSLHQNCLNLGDLKIFAPFTINLDPYLRKSVQESLSEKDLFANQQPTSGRPSLVPPSPVNRPSSASFTCVTGPALVCGSPNRNTLQQLTVDGVVSLLRQIDGFDTAMIDVYAKNLSKHNINGRVLANCTGDDLNDLKSVLGFSFGDWLLFKRIITEGYIPASTPSAAMPVPSISQPFPSQLFCSLNVPYLPAATNELTLPLRVQTNLEKQVTMEETTIANTILLESPIGEESEISLQSNNTVGEVGVIYIGASHNNPASTRLSPSVSYTESEFATSSTFASKFILTS